MTTEYARHLLAVYGDYARGSESQDMFHVWSAITAVGALMGRKVWLQIGGEETRQFPRLYTVLVAPPGAARKSASISMIMRFVRAITENVTADSSTREALIEHMSESAETASYRQGPAQIAIEHRSLLLAASEFSVFLRDKKSNANLISLLNNWYDCPASWTDRTISRGVKKLDGVFLSILAATTTDSLAQSLDLASSETGIASRFIFVVETKGKPRSPYSPQTDEQASAEAELLERMERIHIDYAGPMRFSKEALEFYEDWYRGPRYTKGIAHPRMGPYIQRKQSHFFALVQIFQAMQPGRLTRRIGLRACKEAVRLLESIEPAMPIAFESIGADRVGVFANRLYRHIEIAGGPVSVSKLWAGSYTEVSRQDFDAAVRVLVGLRKVEAVGLKSEKLVARRTAKVNLSAGIWLGNREESDG